MSRFHKLRAWFGASMPAAATGALFLLGTSSAVAGGFGAVHALLLFAVGGIYAVAVRAVMGLFPVDRWGLAVTGLLAGPIPGVLVLSLRHHSWQNNDDRGAVWLFALLFGLLVGLVEWAVEERRTREFPK